MKVISFKQKVHTFIKEHRLIKPGTTVIVGLSGGPDSVALLNLLFELKPVYNLNMIVAHVDHGWRLESEKEAEFCRKLSQKLGLRFVARKLSDLDSGVKFNGSREEYARKIRRMFFEQLCTEYTADAIALGHHQDDQKENFFIRLIRGASVAGLSGMRPKHGIYIRPLLYVSKEEIFDYLRSNDMLYLTDPSNVSDEFLRNRIRTQLLPEFDRVDDRAQKNLLKTIERLQKTESFLTEHTQKVWQLIALQEGDTWFVDCAQLLAQNEVIRHRLIMHWLIIGQAPCVPTQSFFSEIERFLKGQDSKTHHIHHEWALEKKKNRACIKK